MPSHIPGRDPLEADQMHDEESRDAPPEGDRNQKPQREGTGSKTDRGSHDAAHDDRSPDTDPDSPDADINRDDMIDEP